MNIPSAESLSVEFKSDTTGEASRRGVRDDVIVDAVVALYNTDGGELYIGVEDDGTVSGLNPARHDLRGLEALIANRTMPSIRVVARMLEADGKRVVLVEVPRGSSVASTSDGRMLKRVLKMDGTPQSLPMYPFEIPVRLGDLGRLDYSAEAVLEAGVEAFDPMEVLRLRRLVSKLAGSDAVLAELQDAELFLSLGLVKAVAGVLRPTVTGILLLGRTEAIREHIPTASAAFQVLDGTDVRLSEEGALPLLALIERYEQLFDAQNVEHEMESGMYRASIPNYSKRAFREALVNALAHRSYTILRPVRVLMDESGVTVSSPGGFVQGVTYENLLTVAPHGRNPALADALKRIGLAEKTGRGIDRIFEESLRYGRSVPDYSLSTATDVALFIPKEPVDEPFARMVADEELRRSKALGVYDLLILSELRGGERHMDEICTGYGVSRLRVQGVVDELVAAGLVESLRNGSLRYRLNPALYSPAAVRKHRLPAASSLNDDRVAKVMRLVRERGSASRSEISRLLGVTPIAARALMADLVAKGILEIHGAGRGARYYATAPQA